MSLPLKVLVAIAAVVIFGTSAALALSAFSGGEAKPNPRVAQLAAERKAHKVARLEAEFDKEKRAQAQRNRRQRLGEKQAALEATEAASAGSNGTPGQSSDGKIPATPSSGALAASFAELEGQISGAIGVAFAPLGSTSPQQFGGLTEGHAWSSFKVPITVTLMQQQDDSLTPEQQSLAASAITASDNEAAAALFQDLEGTSGGGASAAIEGVLAQAGAPTEVATAPPPPGAVSSWGQTDWTLAASTDFYGALACGRLLSGTATESVVSLMEQVIPEQQWGLGQASFPSGTSVAFKAGWGPDGSESGPYLVRQAGILRTSNGTGVVVTIAAQDEGGSFEAGVADLDQVADWVAQNIPLRGSC